jgi:predicted GIY-YIG superfamily endonuclease
MVESKNDKKWYLGYTQDLRKRKVFPISNGVTMGKNTQNDAGMNVILSLAIF